MLIEDLAQLPSCFITGTDTEIGKTYTACRILQAWQQAGHRVAAFKPVASGGVWLDGRLRSEDAMQLAAITGQTEDEITPHVFEKPASPHIADAHGQFNAADCLARLADLRARHDRVLVEGVGGWCVPMDHDTLLPDFARAMALPVVLVVAIRLGCINHALLSARQIRRDGCQLIGWVANCMEADYSDRAANMAAIERFIDRQET